MHIEEEEHSTELLRNFNQDAEQEMTTTLEPAAEEEADGMDFVEMYKELKALERRVMVQSQHIQQDRLEIDEGAYQSEEQLEEVGSVPGEELADDSLSEEIAEKQLSEETAELESAAEWKVKATEEEDNMGDHHDLPFDQHEEMQQSSLHKRRRSQPIQ
jgi:hypothetical protein